MLTCGTKRSLPSVPRSKGCLTCISRKKRCDGRRPTCQACEDRKLVCQGYRRQDIVFLNDGWRAPGVAAAAGTKKRNTRGKPGPPKTKTETAADPDAPISRSPSTASPSTATSVTPPPLSRTPSIDRSQLHPTFFLSEFSTQLLPSSHFIADLFRSYFSKLLSPGFPTTVIKNQSLSDSTVYAVDALAQGYFGRANGDQLSVQQSFHKYGMALQSMSTNIAEFQNEESGFRNLSEEEWQHMVFYCLVMYFWELKMSPNSDSWQKHIRALTTAISLRGTSHTFSKANLRLIATARIFITLEAISSRQPVGWNKNEPPASEWLMEAIETFQRQKDMNSNSQYRLYNVMDSLMSSASHMTVVMAQYDQMLANMSNTEVTQGVEFDQALVDLYNVASLILTQIEALDETIQSMMTEVSVPDWRSFCRKSPLAETRREREFWSAIGNDIQYLFDKIFIFQSINDYHTVGFYWMVATSLRLLINDMLALMTVVKPQDMPGDLQSASDQNRFFLSTYSCNVLRTIPFVEAQQNQSHQPFFVAYAFQSTVAALERECEALAIKGNEEVAREYFGKVKGIVERYMEWAQRSKIPLKVVVGPPRHLFTDGF